MSVRHEFILAKKGHIKACHICESLPRCIPDFGTLRVIQGLKIMPLTSSAVLRTYAIEIPAQQLINVTLLNDTMSAVMSAASMYLIVAMDTSRRTRGG